MALGFVGGGNLERRLGDDGTQTRILRLFLEEDQLLLGDGDLRVGLFDSFGEIEESPLNGCPRHRGSVRRTERKASGFTAEPGDADRMLRWPDTPSSRPNTTNSGRASAGSWTPNCGPMSTSGRPPESSRTRCSAAVGNSDSSDSTTPRRGVDRTVTSPRACSSSRNSEGAA